MASKKVSDLIDAIGQIDERFIEQARIATPFTFLRLHRRRSRLLPTLLAAAISLAAILSVTLYLATANRGDKAPEEPGVTQGGVIGDSPDSADLLTVELLAMSDSSKAAQKIEKPDRAFADGVCRLVWTLDGESYYAVSVTDSDDLAKLRDYLLEPSSFESGSGDPGDLRFWICTGNGLSASPYLLYGAWGCGNLFDYRPETVPSDSFSSFLVQLIQKYAS